MRLGVKTEYYFPAPWNEAAMSWVSYTTLKPARPASTNGCVTTTQAARALTSQSTRYMDALGSLAF